MCNRVRNLRTGKHAPGPPIDHIRQTSTLYKSMTGGLLSHILFWQDEEFYNKKI